MGLFGGKKAAQPAAALQPDDNADGLRLEAAEKAAAATTSATTTTAAAPALDKVVADDALQTSPPLDPRRRRLLFVACMCILLNEMCERLAYYSAQTNMVRKRNFRANVSAPLARRPL